MKALARFTPEKESIITNYLTWYQLLCYLMRNYCYSSITHRPKCNTKRKGNNETKLYIETIT